MNRFGYAVLTALLFWLFAQPAVTHSEEINSSEQAFQFGLSAPKSNTVRLSWSIASGTYLYRKKFKFTSLTPGLKLGKPAFPPGQIKNDPFFGKVEVFRNHLKVDIPILRDSPSSTMLSLNVSYQGCSDAGICFFPEYKQLTIDLPKNAPDEPAANNSDADFSEIFASEQDLIAASIHDKSISFIVLSFLGFGLLLSFTPCVFPMIPILSGIVVGHGSEMNGRKAFALSFCYVFASALTYMVFGILAGLFGNNLQMAFQQPAVIVVFSGLFVVLALSMFGLKPIQMPSFIQSKITTLSSKLRSGSWLGASGMGLLSALAVGPCVTAPLAGALIYIGQSGDAVMGGVALFSLGFGMGIPLLIIGTSAGKLLPKAGAWMTFVKGAFGLGLLAIAIWLLGRIIPSAVYLMLWGGLIMTPLMILGWRRRWKSLATLALLYGGLFVLNIATEQPRNYLQMLCNTAVACEAPESLAFEKVSTLEQLQQKLDAARTSGQVAMLDFYADWCPSCQEMKHLTFTNPKVHEALSQVLLLQVDVTNNTDSDQKIMRHFDLIGPPAILFFGPESQEQQSLRIIGFMEADKFLSRLNRIFQ